MALQDDLHDRLPDVACDPGEAATALFGAESSKRADAGTRETATELVVEGETGDQVALERERPS